MLHTTLKNLRAHLRRLVSTSLSVVLGVGFLAATLVIGDSMRTSFDESFTEANAGLAVSIRSETDLGSDEVARQTGTVDLALAEDVAGLDGVTSVVPYVDGLAQIVAADGDPLGGDGPPTLAGSWIPVPELNPYEIAEGRAPSAPDEVVIDRGSSREGDLAVGDTTTILTPAPVTVTVVGIATFGGEDSFGPTTYAAFTTEQAQELFVGSPDAVHRLLVSSDGSTTDEALAARVEALLPPGLEAMTGAEVTSDQMVQIEDDFIGFFESMLLAFAGVALLVATFSIHNTFSILVAQRTRESALLRALGASRRQVIAAVGGEALLVGVVASAAGLLAGLGLARLAVAVMDAAGMGAVSGLDVQGDAIAISVVVGIVVTLVASLAPTIAASRVPPLAAIRDVATERLHASRWRLAVGAVLLAVSAFGLATSPSADSNAMRQAALSGAGLLIATVALGPVIARPVASALGAPIAALRGHSGLLARRNAVRNPRRTSGTAVALTIGVAVVALFTVFAASVTETIDDTVDRSFGGDLVVASQDFSSGGLSGGLATAIDELPEVERAVGIGNAVVRIDGETEYPSVTDPARLDGLLDIDVQQGALAEMGADGMAVSSDLAHEEGWELGDEVALEMADGTETVTIDVVYDSTELLGSTIVHREMWARHTAQTSDVAVLVEAADGVGLAEAKAAVATVTEELSAPTPQDRDEYVDSVAGSIEQVLAVIYGLLVIAVLIALMGIANTMSLSIHERTRELGLLRAVGQTRGQTRSMVRWESVIVAVFGTLTGVVLGVVAGWGLLRTMSEAEGVTTPLTVPVGQLAAVVGIGALAGVLAGHRPARRAGRMDVLQAIATE